MIVISAAQGAEQTAYLSVTVTASNYVAYVYRNESDPKIPWGDCISETTASASTYQVSTCVTAGGIKSRHL